MKKATILVVDDDHALLKLLRVNLERDYRVFLVTNAEDAIQMVALEQPDLVILDIMLGAGEDGFQVCRRIREFSEVPIIMLTAKVQENDKIQGFAVGADDYVTKPFSPKELLSRINAILRRAKGEVKQQTSSIKIGPLEVNPVRRCVTLDEKKIDLTPTEYKLLYFLASHKGQVLLHSEILAYVWGSEYRDEVEYLRVYISRLRQKLEKDPCSPKLLHTLPGTGYVLDYEE
ncbi:MAG: two-component system, OmpR family, operon response regulator KdpE [Bacillota bacterium]|nr:two-component system, OmpR family, operon response regulator KdpE [Bacillota bacterium]MDK2924963.1 two-component system, OmpR family, operon response regulator KdpE [Bacillota bacterium]MDK2960779.1 two-component system, OmpR family, operon response regulator KdpE [Bacillota bacterium]